MEGKITSKIHFSLRIKDHLPISQIMKELTKAKRQKIRDIYFHQ